MRSLDACERALRLRLLTPKPVFLWKLQRCFKNPQEGQTRDVWKLRATEHVRLKGCFEIERPL